MSRTQDSDSAASVAAVGAAVVVATQVGLRATREALFLDVFDADALPEMILGASLFSLIVLLWSSREMARRRPGRLIPVVFAISASLLIGEWFLYARSRGVTAIVLYLHVAALGSFLVSGFWSIVNERFDPRTAKRKIGVIAGGGALGGLLGGLIALAVGDLSELLLLLAIMHASSGLLARMLRNGGEPGPPTGRSGDAAGVFTGLRAIVRQGYLRNIALLVSLTAATATLLDLVLKTEVQRRYPGNLIDFFAVFYALVGLATFLIQTALGRLTLKSLGLTGAVLLLPLMTVVGGMSLFLTGVVGWMGISIVRGGEAVLRNSLYRSGYELLYMPVQVARKRAAKSLIDVGFDRIGDGFGALLASTFLLSGAAIALDAMLLAAVVTGLGGGYLALRLHGGYVDALKLRLHDRAEELAIPELRKSGTQSVLMRTLGSLDLSQVLPQRVRNRPAHSPRQEAESAPAASVSDPVLAAMADLRSGSSSRIRARLEQGVDPILAGQAISLLASDDVARDVVSSLRRISDRIVGELTDALLDAETPAVVRRRLPRVLAASASPRAVRALVSGLDDTRFEVRFQCGVALSRIGERRPRREMPRGELVPVVLRELDLKRSSWTHHRPEEAEGRNSDGLLGNRVSLGLEHVFRLLGLMYEKAPLQLALRGLHTDDPYLRGTALEYLESTLPSEIREALFPIVEGSGGLSRRSGPVRNPRADLLMSRRSIELNLTKLQGRARDKESGEPGREGDLDSGQSGR